MERLTQRNETGEAYYPYCFREEAEKTVQERINNGKTNQKIHQKKPNKYMRQCEGCVNDCISKRKIFRCRYCGYINGTDGQVAITKGGLDD